MPEDVWIARGSRAALHAIRPLAQAHAQFRIVRLEECAPQPYVEFLAQGVTGRVPEDPRLGRFAEAAAAVCQRDGPPGPVALLAQWDERARDLAETTSRLAPQALFWPAHVITGRELPAALGIGLGASVYFGHGHCGGWDGYWGLDARRLCAAMNEPQGIVFSFTCDAAKRPTGGFSFCEELVLEGYCAAAYGCASRTSHKRNGQLGLRVCAAMRSNCTLAEILGNCGASWLSRAGYRVFGDPLARCAGGPQAAQRAREVESLFWRAESELATV